MAWSITRTCNGQYKLLDFLILIGYNIFMLGSIIGDIAGSVFEFNNIKVKGFSFFDENKDYTDDSVLTVATADWLLNGGMPGDYYYRYARMYPNPMGAYGSGFLNWVHMSQEGALAQPYNSCGNGSAMRVGPVGWAFDTLNETLNAAKASAECTHNHPEGIKGAQATAHAIFMARNGASVDIIRDTISREYGYDLSLSVDEIRAKYSWEGIEGAGMHGATCQGSVPQAITCALEAVDFEDAIRNAVSIGGDSDTIACITGSIAEAIFDIPDDMYKKALDYLPEHLRQVIAKFEKGENTPIDIPRPSVEKPKTEPRNIINQTNNNMAINEEIQKIIDKRKGLGEYSGKGHLEKIKKCKNFLETLKEKVDDFEKQRQNVLKQETEPSGEFHHFFVDDPTFSTRIQDASTNNVSEKINECIAECERLYKRFNRDTINISVVGLARQGKSCLLQSISKLPNSVIPASDGGDCTGTTSIICNKPGVNYAYADIYYFKPDEILEHVKRYIKAIGLNTFVAGYESIPDLKNTLVKDYDNGLKSKMTSKQKCLFIHLRKYIEHFSEYNNCVIKGHEENVPQDEIRRYVAQYDENGINTYSYLAVKEVRIYTEFAFSDAGKIVMVDTIGLGDTSLGIEEKMLETLRNNSDASFMVRLAAKTGDHWSSEDNRLHGLVEQAMGKEMLDKWLYLVLNTSDALGNAKSTEVIENGVNSLNLHFAGVIKVDCKNPEEVQTKLLTPTLKYLSTELEKVDSELMEKANEKFAECYAAYVSLYDKVHNILTDSPQTKSSMLQFAIEHWDNIKGQITEAIGEVYSQYRDNQYSPCVEVNKAINDSRESIYNFVPSEHWYVQQLKVMDIHAGPNSVYDLGLNILRSKISSSFEDINLNVLGPLQEMLKWTVADVLYRRALWCNMYIESADNSECSIEWLNAFAEEKLGDYPRLKKAVQFILDYQMSMADLLDYEVESSLEILVPGSREYQQLNLQQAQERNLDLDTTALGNYIWNSTINIMPTVEGKLNTEFDLLTKIPSHSLYARIRKFREKVVMDNDTMLELRKFYIENCASIWHNEYCSALAINKASSEILKWIDMLAKFDKSRFTIKL